MKKYALIFFTIIFFCFLSCKKDKKAEVTEEPEKPATAENKLNQVYGTDPKQQFNIYLPANRTTSATPVLFLIHGGAWIEGDRSDLSSGIDGLRNMFPTYAFVTLSYRLYANGTNKFPTQEQDVKTCIEYILNHHSDFKISQKFGLMGFSAGAHLSLLYAYKYGTGPFKPKAVVDFFGPTDLMKCYTQGAPEIKTLLNNIAGNPTSTDSLLYISSSPTAYITQNSTPTLILHGSEDVVVPYQQAEILNAKLQLQNVVHDYKLYQNEGHGFSDLSNLDALIRVQSFLSSRLN